MSNEKKAAESAWRHQAVEDGLKFARFIFEKRGNHSEAHLTEAELAAMMAVSFERGAMAARWLEENREAIESSNQYVEEHGLPLEKYRLFWAGRA